MWLITPHSEGSKLRAVSCCSILFGCSGAGATSASEESALSSGSVAAMRSTSEPSVPVSSGGAAAVSVSVTAGNPSDAPGQVRAVLRTLIEREQVTRARRLCPVLAAARRCA